MGGIYVAKELMLGNEALARGLWEAGVDLVSSYPGTPSTEITEYLSKYPEVYAEWAANEKVALEVAVGASVGGIRAVCCMKHVGVNVAADPLYTAAYTGVNAGLVIVAADDPGMHSSQNEQDSRMHARASHVPMLEPSDSEECRYFAGVALQISEEYDTPVMLRTCTRVAHARSLVNVTEREERETKPYVSDVRKYVMMPGMAIKRHVKVEERENRLAADGCGMDINRMEMRDASIGVICAGAAYQYVREALPEASVLKLGLVNPLPRGLIEEFAGKVDKLYVVEELEPFMEEQIASWGIQLAGGKDMTGRQGELSVRKVRDIFGVSQEEEVSAGQLPARPPVMCPGCPHRGPYYVLHKLHMIACGDIGCYTLGALEPLSAIDTSLCMGASIGMAQGILRAHPEMKGRVVAVIGDSTFVHSGITSLVSAVYNESDVTVMILDNTTTGMTGHQNNPANGRDIYGGPAPRLSLEALCVAVGVKNVRTVDSFDLANLESAIKEETANSGVSVIVVRHPCALLDKREKACVESDPTRCRNCRACMKIGCPAIEMRERGVYINPDLCVGCGLCTQMCKFGAIGKAVTEDA